MRLTALGRSAAQWSRRLKICSSTCRTSQKESQPCACTGSQRAPRLTMRGRCRWAKEQSTAECHNSSAGSSERRIATRSAMRRLQKARHVKALSPGPISPSIPFPGICMRRPSEPSMPAAAVGSAHGVVRTHRVVPRDRQSEKMRAPSGHESQNHQFRSQIEPCAIHGRRPAMGLPIR